MRSIEERLSLDIAAVTEGVVVTESDLWEARRAVDERVKSKRRRDRLRTVALVAAAAVVVAGAGAAAFGALGGQGTVVPAGPGPTVPADDPFAYWLTGDLPTAQLIDGFWREDDGGLSLLFTQEGTVQLDAQGALYSNPGAWGTYEVDGDTIAMTFEGGAACKGKQQTMRASLMPNGDMRAVSDNASGGDCSPLPTYRVTWQHVLPTSSTFDVAFSKETGWKSLKDQALNGDWAAEGGGYVLEMTPRGSYYVLDESAQPIDEGRWSLEGNDLVLTSSARSVSCKAGDRLVLGNVQTVNPGTPVIRGTVSENACNGTWTPKTWFLIPNDGS